MRFSGRTLCSIISVFLLLSAANMVAQPADQNSTAETASAFKASHSISLSATNGKSLSPSYFYSGKRVSAEVRYNWDDDNVGAVCIGKPIGKDSFKLIPEACGYVGKWNGYGPEMWILSETHRFSVVSYVQYVKTVDANQMGYSWFQFQRKASKWLNFGIGGQVLKDGSSPVAVDLGPIVKFIHKRVDFYINPTWRTTTQGRGERVVCTALEYEL